nr:unnamed protein product [Callosobruchus analis]
MTSWEGAWLRLLDLKQKIINEPKRVLKKQIPTTEFIRLEIRDNLLTHYNQFVREVIDIHSVLDDRQFILVEKLFSHLRDRVIRSYQVLRVPYKVPTSCIEFIQSDVLEDEMNSSGEDTETQSRVAERSNRFANMQFDGSFERLHSFLDALTFIKVNSSKLVGKARDLFSDNDSLEEIIFKLTSGIRTESSQLVSSKLLALKQYNKDASRYSSEVEALEARLKRVYIAEGVPGQVAAPCQQAHTKFVTVSSEENTSSVLYTNKKRFACGGYRHFRGNM